LRKYEAGSGAATDCITRSADNRLDRKESVMPNPKRRHSKARTSKRRAHDALTATGLSECPNCHERKLPHRVCAKCGYYKGREVLEAKEA
jgi:large subunit ribosomal protein L32